MRLFDDIKPGDPNPGLAINPYELSDYDVVNTYIFRGHGLWLDFTIRDDVPFPESWPIEFIRKCLYEVWKDKS